MALTPHDETPKPSSKIRHIDPPKYGSSDPLEVAQDNNPLPVASSDGPQGLRKKITAIEKDRRHEDEWARTPNTTGQGAIHVRTFHCKLTDDAMAFLDQSINEWLDAHPQYEVKLVTTTVGMVTGKIKDPHLICQVWV